MPDSPTIVSAALSDKELQASINQMVANFDKGLQTMLEHSNEYVGKIQASLQKIGNTSFGAKGSNDGAVVKQTKAQNDFTDAVKRSTNEIKRQGKEGEMSFDQIAAALSKARQTVSEFNTKRASGILPSSEDYKRYEQALARIVEYNDKLKQSAIGMANANERWFGSFNAKRINESFLPSNKTLSDMKAFYQEQEKSDQKRLASIEKERAAREKMIESARKAEQKYQDATLKSAFRGALTLPTNSIDELRYKIERITALAATLKKEGLIDDAQFNRANVAVAKLNEQLNKQLATEKEVKAVQSQQVQPAKSARDSYIAFMQGYKQQAEQIRRLMEEEQKAMQQRKQGIVGGLSNIIEGTKAHVKELSEEISKLYKERPDGYRDAIKQRTEEMNALKQKIRELTEAQKNLADSPVGASNRYLELEKEYNRIKNIMIDTTNVQRQSTQAQQQATNANSQQSRSIDEMNAYIRQNIQREQERRDAIRQTGLAAQDTFTKIRQNAQIQLAENTDKPIKGIKELADAITNMRRLYFDMSTAERESPLGLAIKRDIENAQKLKFAIDAYNRTLAGMTVVGTKNNANSSLGAYTELTNILKTLSDEYKRLGREERNAAKGNDLADKIQRLSRATQKIQQQMNRPISFAAAMKGSEKTLDDIAYKMQRLRAYRQGIDLTKPNAANEIKQVDEALAKLQKDADKWMSKSQEMIKNNTALGRSWNYMKNRLAFYFTVGASTQFIKNLIDVRSQYEMNERALGILINSAERGTQIFNELSQMALVSPYTLIELSSAAKQLTAYDVAAKDVVDTTRRLADMAAAVGIPIERLTYALGQIKAYGYLNARDARMFSNAGIPLVKQLAEHYTELEGKMVSTADVYDRIKKKAIDMTDVMQVINKMTDEGGKFFDFQAKMADTLKVRLANLTLAWNNMLNDMGKETQGVLTWGIGALREMFLHWKQLDSLIKNAAWALGIRTALMFIAYSALKAGAALGVTTKQMALSAVFGERLANVLKTVAATMKTVAMSKWTWISLFAIAAVEATQAIFGVNEAQKALNESIRNGAKDNYNNISKFLEQYKEIRESLYATQKVAIGNIYNPTTRKAEATAYAEQQVEQDIDKNEAKKAWEAVREQIELTVVSSDKYIGNLLSISNMSERVRQGFNLLDDIQIVNSALKELDDNTIKITQDYSAWWNAWQAPDGLIGNLKDYQETLNDIIAEYGTLESFRENTFLGGKGSDDLNDYETALERFRDDLQKTTDSIISFIELKGWSGDESKINQVFEQITQKLVLDNQLDPQKAFTLQTEVEEARSNAAKQALLQRINDEKEAYKISHDEQLRQSINADVERYNSWNETNGRSKVEWERFTKWLKEQHISETTAMFRNMDAEDIKSLNFQEGKHAEWVTRMVTQYAKEHKMSYDEAFNYLKSWVRSANQWSIFIPMTISTEDKKSVYDQLGEYDKAIDDADAQIERLTKRINELNAKKKKSKEETRELANAERELSDAQKAKADAEAKGGHGKKEKKDERAANKAAKQAESELAKALKDELSTIDKVRSIYKDLTKEGMSHANAVERATRGWEETVNAINRVLQKNGLQKLDLSKFAGIENPRELVNMLQSQLNTLLKRGAKPAEIKELQTKVNTWEVDADKYDLTKITKGLNNELGKLKDEYELAVELDADPELGNAFANMMGIDIESLPHTVKEYADQYSKYLNKYLKGKDSALQFTGDELRGLTRDDITAFRKQVDAGSFNQEWFDAILKAYEDISGKRKKDLEETEKWKNSLIEKYGNLQDKLTKIYKDSVQNQINAVKSFGAEDQKSEIVRLQLRLEATDDPAELANINLQIAEIVKDVTDKHPIALKLVTASDNQTKADTSKAYWEDFKNSELYTMTFEDMANNSTRAIQLIMDKLNGLKDKVKEDPASMKALIKSLEDAQKELNTRDPFGGVARSLRDMANASQEAKTAQKALWRAEVDVEQAQQEVDNSEDGTPEEQAAAQQKLADAVQRRATAQVKLTQAENKCKKAQENLKSSLQGISNQLGNVQDLFGVVSKLFRAGGDDETADAIDAISEGFGIMTTVIMGVVAAMIILQSTTPWLLAIAAALSVVVGLVSFLSGNSNKKITEQVEESERAVKRLENAYKNLEYAAGQAFGTAVAGAKQAMKANKELQLVELKRQLALEQSRDSKNRDEDKIIEIRGQIIDLEHEINDFTKNAVNELLGISSHGDFFESMISEMIEAFKNGEDAMEVFEEKWSDMIDNMIMKSIVSQVLSQWVKTLENGADEILEKYTQESSKKMADLANEISNIRTMDAGDASEWIYDNDRETFNKILESMGMATVGDMGGISRTLWFNQAWSSGLAQKIMDAYLAMLDNNMAGLQDKIDKESLDATGELIDYYGEAGKEFKENYLGQILDKIQENWNFGKDSEKQLSNLQQGISQISETTANALEAYMNSVNQQVYYHSSLLEQIRDSVVGLDLDVSLGVQSQMLLQLQNSYQTQQAIQQILEGVLVPSGRAFAVELLS